MHGVPLDGCPTHFQSTTVPYETVKIATLEGVPSNGPLVTRSQNMGLQSPPHFLFLQSGLHHLLSRMSPDETDVPRYSGRPKEGQNDNIGEGMVVFVAGTSLTSICGEFISSSRFPLKLPISNAPHFARPAICPSLL